MLSLIMLEQGQDARDSPSKTQVNVDGNYMFEERG